MAPLRGEALLRLPLVLVLRARGRTPSSGQTEGDDDALHRAPPGFARKMGFLNSRNPEVHEVLA